MIKVALGDVPFGNAGSFKISVGAVGAIRVLFARQKRM